MGNQWRQSEAISEIAPALDEGGNQWRQSAEAISGGHQRDRTCSRSRHPSAAAASRRDCSSCASAFVRAASASLSCDCECERDPIRVRGAAVSTSY